MSMELNNVSIDSSDGVAFRCHFCGYEQQVKDHLEGRRARCPRCGRVSRVATSTFSPSDEAEPVDSDLPPDRPEPASKGYVPDDEPADSGDWKRPISTTPAKTPSPSATKRCPHCHKLLEEAPSPSGSPAASPPSPKPTGAVPAPAAGRDGRPTATAGTGDGRRPLPPVEKETRKASPAVTAERPSSAPTSSSGATRVVPASPASPVAGSRPAPQGASQGASRNPPPSPLVDRTKTHEEPRTRCPYCREEIHAYSRKCKHCGEYLEETLRAQRTQMVQSVKSPKGFGFSLPTLSRRQKVIGLAATLVIVGGLVFWASRPGGASQAARAGGGTKVVGGSGGDAPAEGPAIETLAAALKKALEGTEAKDLAGNATQFSAAGPDAAPWTSDLNKDKGVILLPYRFLSADPKIPSTRGVVQLELSPRGRRWDLTGAFRRATFRGLPGKDSAIPEDDQQTLRLPENDAAVLQIKGTLQQVQSKP